MGARCLVLCGLALAALVTVATAGTITYEVQAFIDSRDDLVIQGCTLKWHHIDGAAPGRWQGHNEATTIASTLDGKPVLAGVAWTPVWPKPAPDEIRFPADSAAYTTLGPPLPAAEVAATLAVVSGPMPVTITQNPMAANGYTLVVHFQDDAPDANWYDVRIAIDTAPTPVPAEPARADRIPHGNSARTSEYVHRLVEGFYKRTIPNAYTSIGTHEVTWGEAAGEFLKASAAWLAEPDPARVGPLVTQGKAVVEKGCDNGLVLYGYGMALLASGEVEEAEKVLKRAVAELGHGRYHRFHAAVAAALLAGAFAQAHEDAPEAATYRDLSIRYLGEAASASGYDRGEQRIFLDWLETQWDTLFDGRQEAVNAAVQANPSADPYIAKVVAARYHVWAAWEVRGSGWSQEVSEEQWVPYRAHMRAARELLLAAYQLDPRLPEAPSDLICVTVAGPGGDGPQGREWFYRAAAAQLDYQPAYESLLWYLRPRWRGSRDLMYEFGVECLNTGRFDTQVPMVFLLALNDLMDDLDGEKTYWRKLETAQHLETLFAGYEKAKLSPAQRDRLESIHAATDYLTGHYQQAKERLAKLGDHLNEDVFEEYAGPVEAAKEGLERAQ
ncbi:MAG: DUF4034 domain-containing protein [Armatimonadota bacterium]